MSKGLAQYGNNKRLSNQIRSNMNQLGLDFFQKYKHDHIQHHTKDLETLELIQTTDEIKNNHIAKLYLENKYNIRMSSIPFELFLSYIQDKKYMHLIRIVNQYFNIHIATSKLAPASAGGSSAVEEEGIAGHTNDQTEEFHEMTRVQLDSKVCLKLYSKEKA
jgi:transcription initiation factor TFIID subunit 5